MFNRLNNLIKDFKGNVLVIGLDDKSLSYFNKNNKINLYSISKDYSKSGIFKKKNKVLYNEKNLNKGKNINIKKLRKYINNKSIDYLILNMDEIIEYYKYIIRDTINVSNNKIYIYASNNISKDFIISRYKRYNVDIDITDYKDNYLITIDNKNIKNNFIKNKIYFIKDTLYNIAELIGNILAS